MGIKHEKWVSSLGLPNTRDIQSYWTEFSEGPLWLLRDWNISVMREGSLIHTQCALFICQPCHSLVVMGTQEKISAELWTSKLLPGGQFRCWGLGPCAAIYPPVSGQIPTAVTVAVWIRSCPLQRTLNLKALVWIINLIPMRKQNLLLPTFLLTSGVMV